MSDSAGMMAFLAKHSASFSSPADLSAAQMVALKQWLAAHLQDVIFLDNGRIQFPATGHETPCKLDLLEAHVQGKKFQNKKLAKGVDTRFDPAEFAPYIRPHRTNPGKMYCTLTSFILNRNREELRHHLSGRRVQNILKGREKRLREQTEKPEDTTLTFAEMDELAFLSDEEEDGEAGGEEEEEEQKKSKSNKAVSKARKRDSEEISDDEDEEMDEEKAEMDDEEEVEDEDVEEDEDEDEEENEEKDIGKSKERVISKQASKKRGLERLVDAHAPASAAATTAVLKRAKVEGTRAIMMTGMQKVK